MFGQRRLAKRSIIGTRISGRRQDGRFYPGVIQDVNTLYDDHNVYTVLFDDGFIKNVQDTELIGAGFGSVGSQSLKRGQKVFLTYNGREINGVVFKHKRDADEVLVQVTLSEGREQQMYRRLDEVRLCESRKSSRLQDHTATDYSKMADVNIHTAAQNSGEPRKRAVSHVIDVPASAKQSKSHCAGRDEDVTMDENMAAMVLTALSCSPVSPVFPGHATREVLSSNKGSPDSYLSTSVKSASPSPTAFSLHVSPSATAFSLHVSKSAPSGYSVDTASYDEGIDMEVMSGDEECRPKKRKNSTRTVFKCTWPGCGKVKNHRHDVEKHVRQMHLGPKSSDSDTSDDEEDFYYTEVEVNVDNMTETFAQMYTSSPPDLSTMDLTHNKPAPDHDYQKKLPKFHIPEDAFKFQAIAESSPAVTHSTGPINIPSMRTEHVWPQNTNTSFSPTSVPNRGSSVPECWSHSPQSPKSHSYSGSPKQGSFHHKKQRSEVKKCRKVYGMENRDLWCTQCKWKKACTRFIE